MGYLQEEWLVYFYEAPDHPYQDAMKFLKKGFKRLSQIVQQHPY